MKIETKKNLIVGPAAKSNVGLGVQPGVVGISVENDGVEHVIALQPAEAQAFAVAIVEQAFVAKSLGAAQKSQANGVDRGDPVPAILREAK